MSEARKVISNTVVQMAARVVTALLGVISVKLITNYLSQSMYGEYTAIYDFTAIFTIVADFGLFTIAVREMAHDEKKIPMIFGNVLAVRMTIAVLAFSLAIFTAFLIPQYRGSFIPFGVVLVAIANALTLLAGTVSSVLQVHLKMHWVAVAQIIGKVFTVAYIAFAIFFLFPKNPQWGFHHLLYAWIFGMLFTVVLTLIPAHKLTPVKFRFDKEYWKEVLIKALPYGIALLLAQLYFRTGTVMMSLFGLKEETGMYGVAVRGVEIGILFPAYFMSSLLPVLTRALKETGEKAKRIIQHGFDAMAILALPLLFGGIVLAKPLVAVLASDEYISSGGFNGIGGIPGSDTALTIVLFGMTFIFLHYVFGYSLVALGKQNVLLKINAVAAFTNITLNIILIPKLSFIGVSISAVVAEFIIFTLGFFALKKHLSFTPKFWLFIKTLFCALVMGLTVYFIDTPLRQVFGLKSLFLLIPIGGIIYIGFLILTKTITPEMLKIFRKGDDNPTFIAP